MNIKESVLEMDRIYAEKQGTEPVDDIQDLVIIFLTEFQLFDMCKYVSEDDEWVTFIMLPPEKLLSSEIMTLKKSIIDSFGISYNGIQKEIRPKIESDGLYQ